MRSLTLTGLRNEGTTKTSLLHDRSAQLSLLIIDYWDAMLRQKAIPHRCPSGPLDAKGKCFVDGTPDANGVCDHTKCLAQEWTLQLDMGS